MLTAMLVMSILFAVVSGQLSFWLLWAVANRCRASTAYTLVALVALCAGGSSILTVEYVRAGGGWLALVAPWTCYAVGLFMFHALRFIRMEVWTRVEMFFYNLTKKKETK